MGKVGIYDMGGVLTATHDELRGDILFRRLALDRTWLLLFFSPDEVFGGRKGNFLYIICILRKMVHILGSLRRGEK
jgi:hypothetical protein